MPYTDAVFKLPDEAIYGSPIYIHSHADSFYNQLEYQSSTTNIAMQQIVSMQNGVLKVLRDNIKTLQQVHDNYKSLGIDLELMDFSNSFIELKDIKAESLNKKTIGFAVGRYRKAAIKRLEKVLKR
jgi:hypothetical protein